MKFVTHTVAASLLLLASSCGNVDFKADETAQTQEIQLEHIQAQDTTTFPQTPTDNSDEKKAADNQGPGVRRNFEWDKKIIKTGRMEVEVDDYDVYNDKIHELVKGVGGYVSNEQLTNNEYKIQNDISIRIPVEVFDETVQQVAALKSEVRVREISAQDVTAEYFDTRARIEAKKRVRIRYLDMLNKAKNMEEILQVEREINAMQEQIDAGEGRLKYLGHSATYSTLNLSFYQVLNSSARDTDKPLFGDRFVNAFASGANVLAELVIVAATLWPLWVLAIFVVVIIKSKKLKVKS